MAIVDNEEYEYGYNQAWKVLRRPVAAWSTDDADHSTTEGEKLPEYMKTFLSNSDLDESFPYRPYVTPSVCSVSSKFFRDRRVGDELRNADRNAEFVSPPSSTSPFNPYGTTSLFERNDTILSPMRVLSHLSIYVDQLQSEMGMPNTSNPIGNILPTHRMSLSDSDSNFSDNDNDTRTWSNIPRLKECKESQLDSFETMSQLADLVVNYSQAARLFPTRNHISSSGAQMLLSSPVNKSIQSVKDSIISIGKAIPRRVCQRAFKAKDIVWVCRTCQTDETCVLCHECYSLSDHEGHDVGFHYAQAGGCCDCGDPDAWNPDGFCPHHGSQNLGKNNGLEVGLEDRVRGVVVACSEWLVQHLSDTIQYSYDRANPTSLNDEDTTMIEFGVFDPDAASRRGEKRNASTAIPDELDGAMRFDKMKFDAEKASTSKSRRTDQSRFRNNSASSFSLNEVKPSHPDTSKLPSQQLGLLGSQQQGLYLVLHADEVHVHSISDVMSALRELYSSLHRGQSSDVRQHIERMTNKIAQLYRELGDIIIWGVEEVICELGRTIFQCWKDGDLKAASHVGALMMEKAKILKSHGLVVSIKTRLELCAEVRAAVVVDFLSTLSMSCDPLCNQVSLGLGMGKESDYSYMDVGSSTDGKERRRAASSSYLTSMLMCDLKMPRMILNSWHSLLLTLLAVPNFKAALANAYCDTYEEVTEVYAKGVGLLESSSYTLSVQFLNRPTYVRDLVRERGLLQSLGRCLLQTLSVATASDNDAGVNLDENSVLDPMHPVILHRRYSPCISDLRCVLNVEGMPRLFSLTFECLDSWIGCLSLGQYMDEIVWRKPEHGHVEIEPRGWMGAFNASISFGGMFERLLKWEESDPFDKAFWLPTLRSVADMIDYTLRNGLNDWQENEKRNYINTTYFEPAEQRCPSCLPLSTVSSRHGTSLAFKALPVSHCHRWSFHLPLHRFVAACIREVSRRPSGSDEMPGLIETFEKLRQGGNVENVEKIYSGMVEFPTLILARAAQTRAGLWARNGSKMMDQVLNYAEIPFCRNLRDSDILLVQFALLGFKSIGEERKSRRQNFGCCQWIHLLLHRFGVFEFAGFARAPDSDIPRYKKEVDGGLYPQEKQDNDDGEIQLPWTYVPDDDPRRLLCLFEELLHVLIVTITEMPHPPIHSKEDQSIRAKQRLRREIIHRLASGPKTHSELAEALHVLQLRDKDQLTEEGKGINPDDAIGAALESSLKEVAQLKKNLSFGPDTWELSPECWREYDPAFYHTSARSHQIAAEMRPIESSRQNKIASIPYVPRPPDAHRSFEKIRKDLTSDSCVTSMIYRVLHIHCRREDPLDDFSGLRGKDAYRQDGRSETLLARAVHILTLGAYAWEDSLKDSNPSQPDWACEEGSVFSVFSNEPSQSDWVDQVLLGDPSYIMDCDWYEGADTALELLHKLAMANEVDKFHVQDKSVRAGALWLCEYAAQCNRKAAVIIGRDSSEQVNSNCESDKQRRRREAQERAMRIMKENMARFASSVDENKVSDSDEESGMHHVTSTENQRADLVGLKTDENETCCRREKHSDHSNTRLLQKVPQCIICADDGSYCKHDDPLVLCAYVQASTVCKRGGTVSFNDESTSALQLNVNSNSVGAHVSLCGHAMHYSCFESHIKDLLDREERDEAGKRQPEFKCPLCRRLSNCLIPFIDVGSDWCEWGKAGVDRSTGIKCENEPRSLGDFLGESKWWGTRNDNSVQWNGRCSFLPVDEASSNLSNIFPSNQRQHRKGSRCLGKKDLYMTWNTVMNTSLRGDNTDCTTNNVNQRHHVSVWKTVMNQISDISYRCDVKRWVNDFQFHIGEFRHYILERNAYNLENESSGKEQHDWPSCISTTLHHEERSELSREKLISKLYQSIQAFTYSSVSEFIECRRIYHQSPNERNETKKELCTKYGIEQLACEGFFPILIQPDSSSPMTSSNVFNGRVGRLRFFALSLMAACSAVSRETVFLMLDLPSSNKTTEEDNVTSQLRGVDSRAPLVFPLLCSHILTHVVASMCAACGKERARSDAENMQAFAKIEKDELENSFLTNTSVYDCEHFIELGFIARVLQVLLGWFQHHRVNTKGYGDDAMEELTDIFQYMLAYFKSTKNDSLRLNTWEKGCFTLIQVGFDGFETNMPEDSTSKDYRHDFQHACSAAKDAAFEYLCHAGSILQILMPGKATECNHIMNQCKKSESSIEDAMAYCNVQSLDALLSDDVMKEVIRNWLEPVRQKETNSRLSKRLCCKRVFRVEDWPLTECVSEIAKNEGDVNHSEPSLRLHRSVPFFGRALAVRQSKPHLKALPVSYTDLYAEMCSLSPDSERTAVCLVCGEVIDAGGKRNCTKHAVECGGGCGMFFLLQDCTSLIVHKDKAAYTHSPYVDSHGETPQYHGRPLNLDSNRYAKLHEMWSGHLVRQEVISERSRSSTLLANYY